jgi:hypothetical protein
MTDWTQLLRAGKKAELWAGFQPASEHEIEALQAALSRPFPDDFRQFYSRIGYGRWPTLYGGGIYSPEEILQTIGAPIYFVLGSHSPGSEWATTEQHAQLWLSKGECNPAPMNFTAAALSYHGVQLTDLLQIGTDGCAGYQMIHLSSSSSVAYMVIPESGDPDFVCESFKEGILRITDWLVADDDA